MSAIKKRMFAKAMAPGKIDQSVMLPCTTVRSYTFVPQRLRSNTNSSR